MAKQVNINIFSGDSYTMPVSFVDVDANEVETPINITDYTCFFTAKRSPYEAIDAAVVHNTWTDHDDATAGLTSIRLFAEDTALVGSFYYCFGYFDGDGEKKTVFEGKIVFKKSTDETTEP